MILFVLSGFATVLVILIPYYVLDAPRYALSALGENKFLLAGSCTESALFSGLLLAQAFAWTCVTAVLSWLVRNVREDFNESFHMFVAVYAVLSVALIIIPVQVRACARALIVRLCVLA